MSRSSGTLSKGALLLSLALSLVSTAAFSASPLKEDPILGGSLFKHYCAVCHGLSGKGNGVNAENLDPHPTDLAGSEVTKLSDEEIYEVIEKGGAAVELSVLMPPWGRTLSPSQIASLVAYIRALGKPEQFPQREGQKRFFQLRAGGEETCSACHIKPGKSRPIAPNIGHAGSKLNPKWLYQFLKNPHRVRLVGFIPLTKARMPNFYFSDEELRALTEFLITRRDAGILATAARGVVRSAAEIKKGRRLFEDEYGCVGCHRTGKKEGGIVGPDLSMAPRRLKPEWIYYWLKNPQAIQPDSPMPNFGLPASEIYSLMAYILSLEERNSILPPPGGRPIFDTPLRLEGEPVRVSAFNGVPSDPELIKKGEKLVKDKNCAECHTLDSYNSQTPRRR